MAGLSEENQREQRHRANDARRATVAAPRARIVKLAWRAAAVAALSLTSACKIIPYSAETVSLRVQGNVPDAQVTIDDIPIGALAYVAAHGVALPPGKHRVTVERAGYFPWDAVLEAQDEPIHLQVKLVPIPD